MLIRRYKKEGKPIKLLSFLLVISLLLTLLFPNIAKAVDLNEGCYNSGSEVYWDATVSSQNASASNKSGDNLKVQSVILNGIPVQWHYSGSDSIPNHIYEGTGGKTLSNYYPAASANNMKKTDLSITPKPGYYITRVVIPCSHYSVYWCETWKSGNAFKSSFELGVGGTTTIKDLSSRYFSHIPSLNNSKNDYFILIETAPLPSPLYVEYDYGAIKGHLGSKFNTSAFSKADNWLDDNSGNVYGTGTIDTNDTQFKYAYNSSLTGDAAATEAAKWRHYANVITDSAAEDAASVGYRFTGWKAEYYTNVSVASNNQTDAYNKYTYTFSNSYGTAMYNPNDQVALSTNVRLIAQWEKITTTSISVEKKWNDNNNQASMRPSSINVQLLADGANKGSEVTLNDANNWKYTWSALPVNNATGQIIKYTVTETSVVPNYTTTITGSVTNGFIIENVYTPKPITISGEKTWDDYGLKELRPDTITVELLANGTKVDSKIVKAEDNWKWSFPDKPRYASGQEIIYTVREVNVPSDYTSNVTGNQENGFVIKNTLKTTSVEIDKTVTGNMGDRNKNFEFVVRILENENATSAIKVENITATKYDSNNTVMGGKIPTVLENGEISFSLKHGEKIILSNLPIGTYLQVKETNADDYEININSTASENNSYTTIEKLKETTTIINVNNEKNAIINTGIVTNNMPFIITLTCTCFGLIVLLICRKKH